MKINYKTVTKILAIVIIYDTAINIANQRMIRKLNEQNRKLADLTTYCAQMIDDHEIPLTEFDAIAIQAITD